MNKFALPNYSEMDRDVLIERILQLEEQGGVRFETHPRYGLTQYEQAMLGILVSRKEVVSKDQVYTLLYGMHDDPPEQKILDVWVCRLRQKLKPYDITIHTVWGRGWFIDPEDKQKVNAMRFPATEAA